MKRSNSFQKLTDSLLFNGSKVINKLSKYSNMSSTGSDSYEVKYHNAAGGENEPSEENDASAVKINRTKNGYQIDGNSMNSTQIKAKLKSNNNNNHAQFNAEDFNFGEQLNGLDLSQEKNIKVESGFSFGR
jgi:hypothetical protein